MRPRSAWLATLGVVAALGVLGSASRAHAQPDAAIEEAKRLFKAGARAYEAGKYRAAWQTFDQAFELTPRPELRFSAAQALRRLYTVEPGREYLERALRYYREYLAAVPQGGRRLDATTAAEEIEKLLGPGAAAGEPGPAVAPPPAPVATPLATLIVDTPTAGARVALADEEPGEPPLVRDLPAGRYAVRITADGYIPIEREVETLAGRVKSLDVELKERPGALSFEAPDGVELVVDGRPVGVTPLGAPVELGSGKHRVVAGKTGYEIFVEDLALARGEERSVAIEIGMTPQRIVAWSFVGLTLAGAGMAAGLAGVAFYQQAQAADLEREQESRALTVEERDRHNAALELRDDFRGSALVAAGFAGGLAVTGLALLLLDEPQLYAVATPPEGADDDEPAAKGALRFVPVVAPAPAAPDRAPGIHAGLAAAGRF